MRRAALAGLLLALLVLAPAASAQMKAVPAGEVVYSEPRLIGGVMVDVRVETKRDVYSEAPFLVSGFDNTLNLTVRNLHSAWWNGTFAITNVSGGSAAAENLSVTTAPGEVKSLLFTVRPEDVGTFSFIVRTVDSPVPQSGEEMEIQMQMTSLPAVVVKFLDPAPHLTTIEEDGVVYRQHGAPYVARLRPGDTISPRMQVENPLETTLPGFELELRVQDRLVGRVDVDPLEPKARRTVEFPEYSPPTDEFGGRFFPGMQMSYALNARAVFSIGGLKHTATPAAFALRNGAVEDLVPAVAMLEVRDGVALEVLAPETLTLGVPTRIRINVANYGLTQEVGSVGVRLTTPYGLHYGVQGPESRSVVVRLAPGANHTEAIEFTPRVTGTWNVETLYYSSSGSVNGFGGTSLFIPSPVSIRVSEGGVVYARLNEPVSVDVDIQTTETLADARIGVSAVPQSYYRQSEQQGEIRQGLAHRLVEATSAGASELGTLRPGGPVRATFEVVSGASGRYTVVPFVVSEGFAYTDSQSLGGGPIMPVFSSSSMTIGPGGMPGYQSSTFDLAVQPRILPSALALAPLTLGLVLFVGTWTLRTRFVK
jgi:hypothetical protein